MIDIKLISFTKHFLKRPLIHAFLKMVHTNRSSKLDAQLKRQALFVSNVKVKQYSSLFFPRQLGVFVSLNVRVCKRIRNSFETSAFLHKKICGRLKTVMF